MVSSNRSEDEEEKSISKGEQHTESHTGRAIHTGRRAQKHGEAELRKET